MANRVLVTYEYSGEEGTLDKERLCNNIESFVLKVMDALEFDKEEVSILLCNNEFIHKLNSEYRKVDSSTDVLSFENGAEYTDEEGAWRCAGDIVISIDALKENTVLYEESIDTELKRLLIHGLLHINGYDHFDENINKEEEPKCEMLKMQEEILKKFCNFAIV